MNVIGPPTVGTWVLLGAFAAVASGALEARGPDALPRRLAASSPITTGFDHACAVTTAGEVYCWGSNDEGELGDGTETPNAEPVRVSGGQTYQAVFAGHNRSCALTAAGAAHCWGRNFWGELGDGTTREARLQPTPVSGGHAFETLSLGTNHTCGVTGAGAVYCWGYNQSGELGDSAATHQGAPVRARSEVSFTSVSAGFDHTCALTANGQAYCWGANDAGELGDGTRAAKRVPTRVAGTTTFAQITAGHHRTCARTSAGQVFCWGRNESVPPGDEQEFRTEPTAVGGDLRFQWIDAGANHSCGVTDQGQAYCWGHNAFGQVGDGTSNTRPGPVAVSGGQSFAFVSAGAYQSCGVSAEGRAFCWGRDLGSATLNPAEARQAPVAVSESLTFRASALP